MHITDAWTQYLLYGGIPKRTDEAKKAYLEGPFKTIYFRDVVERCELPDDRSLANVNEVLMSASGSLTNPTKLANHIGTILGKKPVPLSERV